MSAQGTVMMVAPGAGPLMLALLSGHSMSVMNTLPGSPVEPRFHRKALSAGCVPAAMFEEMQKNKPVDTVLQVPERIGMITDAISSMVSEAADRPDLEREYFTADGLPTVDVLGKRLGFKVLASERDDAWAKFNQDV